MPFFTTCRALRRPYRGDRTTPAALTTARRSPAPFGIKPQPGRPDLTPPLEAMSARGTGDPHTPRSGIVNDETPRWPPWKIIYFGFMCMLGTAAIWLFVLLMLYAFAG